MNTSRPTFIVKGDRSGLSEQGSPSPAVRGLARAGSQAYPSDPGSVCVPWDRLDIL